MDEFEFPHEFQSLAGASVPVRTRLRTRSAVRVFPMDRPWRRFGGVFLIDRRIEGQTSPSPGETKPRVRLGTRDNALNLVIFASGASDGRFGGSKTARR